LLPGRAVRGGGRSSSTHPDEASVAIEVERLRALPSALRRRVLRATAEKVGFALNFDQTELLMAMAAGKAGLRETLAEHLRAERTPRELRLVRQQSEKSTAELAEYELPIPGEVTAEAFGFRLIARVRENPVPPSAAKLRTHKAGDRVRLRYSGV